MELAANKTHDAFSLPSWYFQKCRRGESPDAEKNVKGKMMKNFVFTGKIEMMAELHLSLRKLAELGVRMKQPTAAQILANPDDHSDTFGVIDILTYTELRYPLKLVGFNEFRMYVELAPYKTVSGIVTHQKVITITKKKSKDVLAKLKPGSLEFFLIQIPVKQIMTLIDSLKVLMDMNNIRELDISDCKSVYVTSYAEKNRSLTESSIDASAQEMESMIKEAEEDARAAEIEASELVQMLPRSEIENMDTESLMDMPKPLPQLPSPAAPPAAAPTPPPPSETSPPPPPSPAASTVFPADDSDIASQIPTDEDL